MAAKQVFLKELVTAGRNAKRNYIFNTIQDVYHLYGFQQIETPFMEMLSTTMGKYGDEGDKLLFKIQNSGEIFRWLLTRGN